jgi:TrmH family RNA methyltransferase
MLSSKIVKHINQLQEKKYRREFHEFVVEGYKGVGEALRYGDVALVVVDGSRRDDEDIALCITLAEEQDIPVEFCGRKDIGDIKTTDTFPGILAVVDSFEYTLTDLSSGPIIALENVKDPGNLGTIIRTAEWFGITNVIISENSVDEYNPKVVRSTMGSIFRVKTYRTHSLYKELQELKSAEGYRILSLDLTGKPLPASISKSAHTIFLFGSESQGLSPELEELVDVRYTIPGKGKAESLNLAIATGILMSRI